MKMQTESKKTKAEITLHDEAGQVFTLHLNEAQAVHVLEQCAKAFGWHAGHNPLTEDFMKSFKLGMEIAEKIEGGG